MEINCEKPTIIVNPHLKDLVLQHRNFTLRGRETWLSEHSLAKWYYDFPYSSFSPKILRITQDELNDCFILSTTTGEPLPLFYAVPCGKCIVCRERVANEWACRAMCEAQTSMSIPYFVTLTYNNLNRPSDGVHKEHVQKFMKRLRVNVERYCGFQTNIRFYACAEYGKSTHLPHYHLLLFNLPLLQVNHVMELVQKSWSYMVSKRTADALPGRIDKYGRPIYKIFDETDKRWRALYGYTHTQISTEGRVRYAMKYMRKDARIPEGKNDIFFLSSRRGGLGHKWIEQHLSEFRSHPELINVEFKDIWSDKIYSGILPRFFKDKICPTLSRLVPKDARDLWKKYEWLLNKMSAIIGHVYQPNPQLREKYFFMPCFISCSTLPYKLDSDNYYRSPKVQRHKISKYDYDAVNSRTLSRVINAVEKLLSKFTFDATLLPFSEVYKLKRERYLTDYVSTMPQVPVSVKSWQIRRARRISSYREVF